ncbi:BTB domain and ankyrin repeat protein [Histoplasma capsulatum var. duboisii H88]|uniref:BTB domain and ankyrin repeat protein n=1 Tax=Ajellomyces capsulatus (strain H88) TaxID=544711 RepID=A0A8A1LX03_AJEC8|nr:BTB domain and ankyrin repeat protein [Histoplasma capsulatum var. duboisii H88]
MPFLLILALKQRKHACMQSRQGNFSQFQRSIIVDIFSFFLFFFFPRSTYLALMVMFGLIEPPAGQSLCFATADHNSTRRGRQKYDG